MKGPSPYTTTAGHSDDHIGFFVPTVMYFGQIVYNGVEARAHKIGKLHLYNSFHPVNRQSHSCRNYGRLTDGGVAYSALPKFGNKPFGNFKNTTIVGNILPHDNELVVAKHGLFQTFGDGIYKAYIFCLI